MGICGPAAQQHSLANIQGITTRSVRDWFSLLLTKYAHKLTMEEKASGIDVEQLEKLIEEILE